MRGLARAGLLAITLPLIGGGCAADKPMTLPPIPAQSLPVTVKVPVAVPLPFAMKQPCPDPAARPIQTDADLLAAADAWKVAKRCSDGKLKAIDDAEKKAVAP